MIVMCLTSKFISFHITTQFTRKSLQGCQNLSKIFLSVIAVLRTLGRCLILSHEKPASSLQESSSHAILVSNVHHIFWNMSDTRPLEFPELRWIDSAKNTDFVFLECIDHYSRVLNFIFSRSESFGVRTHEVVNFKISRAACRDWQIVHLLTSANQGANEREAI